MSSELRATIKQLEENNARLRDEVAQWETAARQATKNAEDLLGILEGLKIELMRMTVDKDYMLDPRMWN